jgi:hypothetical protein
MARASAAFLLRGGEGRALLRGGEGRVFERKAGSIESCVPVDGTVEAIVLSAKASCAGAPVEAAVVSCVRVVEWGALEGECAVASLLRSVENRRRVLFWRRERDSAGRLMCEGGASSFKCREEAWCEKER